MSIGKYNIVGALCRDLEACCQLLHPSHLLPKTPIKLCLMEWNFNFLIPNKITNVVLNEL